MDEIETRVAVLEAKMEYTERTLQRIEGSLEFLKQSFFQVFDRLSSIEERISSLQAHTDERISALQAKTDERFSALQARTDERFNLLQAHTDERFGSLQAHTDERISALQARTDERITGLHQAMVSQTRWILGAILGGATLLAFLQKILERLL